MPTSQARFRLIRRTVIALAAFAGAAAHAPAQNALGDGRALDANTRQGGDRRNEPGRNIAAETYFRNAIVTGNVAGGMSFRGDVGYTSANDFRAALGSNDIYSFERDSLASGLAGRGLRGVDAIQQQMRFTTGSETGSDFGPVLLQRSGAHASAGSETRRQPGRVGAHTFETFDPFSIRPGSLRSTSEFLVGRTLSPRVLVQPHENEEEVYLISSPLRGYAVTKSVEPERRTSQNLIEAEAIAGLATGRIEPAEASGRVKPGIATHERVLEELERALKGPALDGEQDSRDARDEDRPRRPEDGHEQDDPTSSRPRPADRLTDDPPAAAKDPREPSPAGQQPGSKEDDGAEREGAPASFESRMADLMQRLRTPSAPGIPGGAVDAREPETDSERRAALMREAEDLLGTVSPRVATLLPPPSAERDLYAEQMAAAQDLLARKRWFDAEERFTTALRLKRGDVMACAGRINAQVGAAMFLSAATNLRALLRSHPEMIGVQYESSLLPGADRLGQIRAELRENITHDSASGRDAGLLLAYLGHQSGDEKDVADGLEATERISASLGDAPDPLIDALRAVWRLRTRPGDPYTK